MLLILLACAPESFDQYAMEDRSEYLSTAATWDIPERARVRHLGAASLGWGGGSVPLPGGDAELRVDSEHLVFDVTDAEIGIVESTDAYRLLLTVARGDLWPLLAETALTPLRPWDDQGAGIRYPAGTRVDDEIRSGDHLLVEPDFARRQRGEHALETWAAPANVDVIFRRADDRFEFAFNALLTEDVSLLDAPDGEEIYRLDHQFGMDLPGILEEYGEAALVLFASNEGLGSQGLVRVLSTHGKASLVEVSIDEEVRLSGYVPTDTLFDLTPTSRSTQLYRCGFMMMQMDYWRQRKPAKPNIPADTFLYADPDGPPIGLTREPLEVDILDRDYGWVLFELQTRWGPVEVWTDGE
ncbi:MAG: hypothetical protein ACI8RZ_000523 [Myxococcota bacterium]|jgi:hypothetical protein